MDNCTAEREVERQDHGRKMHFIKEYDSGATILQKEIRFGLLCTGPYLTNFLQNLAWRHRSCPINDLWVGKQAITVQTTCTSTGSKGTETMRSSRCK